VTTAEPGHDEVVLTPPDGTYLGNILASARAGRAAEVVMTYGTLNDPHAYHQACGALRPVLGRVVPDAQRLLGQDPPGRGQVPARLAVIDVGAPATPKPSGGRA
jgi:hypothetical protein